MSSRGDQTASQILTHFQSEAEFEIIDSKEKARDIRSSHHFEIPNHYPFFTISSIPS